MTIMIAGRFYNDDTMRLRDVYKRQEIKRYLLRHYDYISKMSAVRTMCALGYSFKDVVDAYDDIEWEYI